jgi:hypothetical protein
MLQILQVESLYQPELNNHVLNSIESHFQLLLVCH